MVETFVCDDNVLKKYKNKRGDNALLKDMMKEDDLVASAQTQESVRKVLFVTTLASIL